MKKHVLILFTVVFILGVLVGCRYTPDTPQNVSKKLIKAAANRDVAEGKYHVTSSFVVDSSCLGTDGRELSCFELLMTCAGMSTKGLEYLAMSYELAYPDDPLPPNMSDEDNLYAVILTRDRKDLKENPGGNQIDSLMVFHLIELDEGWSVFNFELLGQRYAGEEDEPFDCNDADWYP